MELLIIPVFLLGVIGIVALWNSEGARRGGRARTAVGNALQTLNANLSGGEQLAALEYLQEVHDEEDDAGGTGPSPAFPGVRDERLVLRPVRPADALDLEELPESAVVAVTEESGQRVGYAIFRPLEEDAWLIQALSTPPDLYVPTARLLLAYLFEMEEAARIELAEGVTGLEACGFSAGVVTPETVRPSAHPFSLRL